MRSSHCSDTDNTQLQHVTHLVVLQHGLLGSKHDFARFVTMFRAYIRSDELYLHATESNASSFFRTYDGVDQGGQRVADEIQQLATQMPKLQKLSMIGHSLGGLYNRYCIGLLLSRGFFDKVEPMNFITLASPHLGTRRPRRGATNVVLNALMPKIFSRTGAQLTLVDEASRETLALSQPSSVHQKKDYHPALSKMEGLLLLSLPASETQRGDGQTFELLICNLSDRKLCVYENMEEETERELKLEIDLSCAEVKILLPEGKSRKDDLNISSFVEKHNGDNDQSDVLGNFDVQIRWSTDSTSDTINSVETLSCVLRIPEEDIQREWKWLVALSNANFGVRCITAANASDQAKSGKSSVPPLLSCLTRGQFNQALQLFKARTLYSSIFFDMQVPYTCAAVRAFNPYRSSGKKVRLSPTYTHIVLNSVKTAHKLRDTIPFEVQRLATENMRLEHAPLSSPSNEDEQVRSGREVGGSDVSSPDLLSSRDSSFYASDSERMSTSSLIDSNRPKNLTHSRQRGQTLDSRLSQRSSGSRPEPFVEGDVILDQLPYAFTADAEPDELRGMLLSVQSVGWRRIDVLFGGVMSHEHIIAKRADLKKPLESGIDVVHHIMDTFLV